jgi:hypothetical protein
LPEIEAALAGTWDATITRGGETQRVKFRIEASDAKQEQHSARGLVTSATACSQRTLVKSAHACIDTTDVALKLIALDDTSLRLTGQLTVPGTEFREAIVTLDLGGLSVTARIEPNGNVKSVWADDNASAKLVHTK